MLWGRSGHLIALQSLDPCKLIYITSYVCKLQRKYSVNGHRPTWGPRTAPGESSGPHPDPNEAAEVTFRCALV